MACPKQYRFAYAVSSSFEAEQQRVQWSYVINTPWQAPVAHINSCLRLDLRCSPPGLFLFLLIAKVRSSFFFIFTVRASVSGCVGGCNVTSRGGWPDRNEEGARGGDEMR